MNPRRGGRWWVGAFAVFLALLGIWAVAAWQLYPAGAGPLTLGLDLHSRLQADYGPDQPGRSVSVLRLSIVEDVLRDLGFSGEEAQAQREGVEAAMGAPVPTATARDFQGAAPFTATLVPTATSTETPVPTATPVPTNTRRPTRTPTRTSPPPAPTLPATGEPASDDENPEIRSMALVPAPGPLETCTILITDMWVTDDAPSSGIDLSNVVFKYEHPITGELIYFPATLISGGWTDGPGSGWSAHYSGSVTITGVEITEPTGSAGPMTSYPACTGPVAIRVWGRVADNAGNYAYSGPHTFDLSTSCP
jgi:hypothetical protein